jgi:hypothetical protein
MRVDFRKEIGRRLQIGKESAKRSSPVADVGHIEASTLTQ